MDMHYYQFHVGDYAAATSHLTEFEDLAYRRMLDWTYTHERPLPDSVEDVARLIRMRSHSDCIASVLREFFERTASGWVNRRATREIESFRGKSEKARQSAKARWDANAMRTHSDGNANQEPRTINQEPRTKDSEPSVLVPQGGAPDCPASEIVELYHDCCPTLPRCMVLSPKRQGLIRQRWREVWADLKFDKPGMIGWFREFFESVQRSDFLTGRAKSDRLWTADLEWLMLPSNFVKVAEGRYSKEK